MSEMGQVLNCLTQIKGQMDKMSNRLDKMDERLDRMDERFDRMDERLDRMDERFDQIDRKFITMERSFDEKLSLVEFGLDAEIQKVYEIALTNQANIEILMTRQYCYNVDGMARQHVADLTDRVDVVESVVQSHSEDIRKIQNAIA